LIIFISIATIFFAVLHSIYNRKLKTYHLLLSAYLIIFSLYAIAHYVTLFGDKSYLIAVFWNNLTPLWLLAGPILYFYVKGTMDDTIEWKWKHAFHILPSLIIFIGLAPYLFSSYEYKISIAKEIVRDSNNTMKIKMNWLLSNEVIHISRPILLFSYILASSFVIINKIKIQKESSRQFRLVIKWLFILLIISFLIIVCLGIMGMNLLVSSMSSTIHDLVSIHNFAAVLFSILPITLLLFPQILYGIPLRVNTGEELNITSSSLKKQCENVNKNHEAFKKLSEKIIKYFENEKPYLKKNFTLTELSSALGVPQHHISYCFSDFMDISFTKLRSSKRIEYSKELLISGITKKYSIDKVAELSGFSSRSSFFTTFKEYTGLTPTEFIKHLDDL
jgi:AraC-like DNA-binding protein